MTIYAAEPGSPTAHALALLASWAATNQDQFAGSTQDFIWLAASA